MRRWTRATAPHLDESFSVRQLADLPILLGRESARRWLINRGVLPARITPHALDQLIAMAADAASPPRADFPGSLLVRRRGGILFAETKLD